MNSNPDDLRRRMSEVRDEIDEEMGQLVAEAKSLVDWRSYVRKYPFATAAAGCVAGYLLVPRRPRTASTGPPIEKLAPARTGVTGMSFARSSPRARRSSAVGSLGAALATFAIRSAAVYASRKAANALMARFEEKPNAPRSPSPANPKHRRTDSQSNGRVKQS